MREVAFIKQNKTQWLAFEQVIYSNQYQKPDYLADMYIQIMNDLAYAQTFYPKSKVTQYLNNLAVQTYQKIYKTKRIEENRIVHFFKTEVPLTIYEYRNYLKFAVLAFTILTAIGVISTHYDMNFTRTVLGDSYVNMTLDNIKNDDVMGVYKSGSNWGSFIGITFNNLYVGLRFFVFGIFAGIGTLVFLFYNAIMIGTFQYMFIQQNAFMDSFRGIWLHGAMEITAMILEAFAGFVFGAGLLFPKTFSRINSFKISFKAGLKIFIATIPFTIAAGFIEGFITRYAKEMPDVLNYLIIFGTLGLIIYYFFIYPFVIHKKMVAIK
ncbi:stage II sporulation protein M [Myroides pelagicus]|uniref:Stage II sporulation protein M n=1 Tax=Myroides pelagicus TaxID=270914 RepID=A0A7K1GQJ6_9FLAO|nr:stage II sporulation protein M [Myroides pelagicus]MEC4114696.1 stage II sporulation protein M [Myroides pelagicus]MTH30464.1 stage II sporulation protein M [Myroides pelagicus]